MFCLLAARSIGQTYHKKRLRTSFRNILPQPCVMLRTTHPLSPYTQFYVFILHSFTYGYNA